MCVCVCVWLLINAQTCTRQDVVAMALGSSRASRSVHLCVRSGATEVAVVKDRGDMHASG